MGRKGFQRGPLTAVHGPRPPINPCNPFPLNDCRTRSTAEFYATQGKKIRAPTVISKARRKFLDVDHKIDGIFTATNPNFEA
jgi:hypothetical protein